MTQESGSSNIFKNLIKKFFCPCHVTCRILVSWPGIEPAPLAVEGWSLNHWTTREVPCSSNFDFSCKSSKWWLFSMYLFYMYVENHINYYIWNSNSGNSNLKSNNNFPSSCSAWRALQMTSLPASPTKMEAMKLESSTTAPATNFPIGSP